ncbi:Protease 3 precursor [Vibrio aerogenes CECT 7868]|uniref:Protease 3 n=1 Tax=Vibrio aerogenes CECT 7868 TaxID=1216006 RepID=A0A1M6CV36_9VIBR|nr:insulinase family protein [Vibrio aerogenes]SHI64588.1 Protease 3 precursor [Vibrio aerogenes CECT 7868]
MHISPNDTNRYRYITLPNQLRVLLIHDENTPKSAAALAINVGHFDDPTDRPGLAHYLEHMLFLGTEKHPQTGEFQNFINQHGGSHNAWTGTEHSCFFFDISPSAFEKALDRFALFFISPLFNEEALDKERLAIESEYKLKINDDTRRLYQVHKETINPLHPFAKFSVGNLQTLSDRNGVSIRQEILDFYQQNYSSDLMTLVMLAPEPLDVLESHANAFFSAIPNQMKRGKSVSVPFVTAEQTGIQIEVEPLKDIRKLSLAFPLGGMTQHYRVKPLSYFAHLLGYEGQNSLMLALKEQGWITSLSAGGGISGSNYREFTVSMHLTEEGMMYTNDIIQAVFHYIGLIRTQGLESWRYEEKKTVLNAAFRYQEPTRPMEMVNNLVMNMQHYQQDDVVCGDYIMEGYDESLLRQILDDFVPENLRVTLFAQGQDYKQTAAWYFTPYSVTPFTQEQLGAFRAPSCDLHIELPEKNLFICSELTPKPSESSNTNPEIIYETPEFRLWHMQDNEFSVPKGVIYVAIDSPYSVKNTRNIVMTRLCVELFLDSLAKKTYQAEIAGMGYNMYAHQGGVTLTISGFSQKQPELLKVILDRFERREFVKHRFDSIKQQLERSWKNAAKDRPISQLFNAMTGILQPNNPPYRELLKALHSIHVEELAPFVDKMLSERHIEMFIYGDWRKSDAFSIGKDLIQALHIKDAQSEESLRPLVMLGKQGTFRHEIHCDQDDSAVVIYYQSECTSPKNIALYSLANHLMSATFFHEIRTKQQLGYMVGTGNLPLNKHPGIVLYVQSPNAGPAELMASIDEFLNAFYLVLLELSEYQWHSSKRGLWNQISAPDTSLRNRAQRLWVAIGNKDTEFSQRDQVLQELRRLSRSDMIRFVVNQLKPRTANRLIMYNRGNVHHASQELTLGREINSIHEFQLMPKAYDLG